MLKKCKLLMNDRTRPTLRAQRFPLSGCDGSGKFPYSETSYESPI